MALECTHRPPCPGCPRLGATDVPDGARSALTALARDAGLAGIDVVRGAQLAFRHRARLAVRGRAAAPKIGLFETGSHRVVHIPRCLVQHPLVNDVASAPTDAMRVNVSPPSLDRSIRKCVSVVVVSFHVRWIDDVDSPVPAKPDGGSGIVFAPALAQPELAMGVIVLIR